ncbi:MAG TPA: 2-hydroxyacyl-CoA dehydratase family protein [Candidatus Intestinimonas pullistercoris]|uniref:2-hydroxyacyl-CoA dehydratase family protein n=1 Tax=Candidatus Intestinimonas pullistercoris TaxID=2838623 RepID=A0A9D2T129_9FIRM|nr:2-hydroxyacyl-CoA dehydratase family protein [uncultured Intestinimonas sp.]HJC41699.1 2-hydroxyacyl-CoA dehydratase family protein [Candidatus Intestinimonas pullistercoris]
MSVKQPSQMSAKELLAYYQAKLDEEARQAKASGKLVCWSASVAPPELCVAMDIAMVYPETHAAGIGARKGALDMLEVADRLGYSVDCCSYGRVNIGYMELLKEEAMTGKTPEALANSPAARVPLPDLVITCNNICNTLLKWYENLAAELNIPCIVIDVPFNHTMPVSEESKAYIADQFRNAISQLEVICGRPFDYEKFHAVRQQTQRSIAQWNRIAAMSQYKPSPLNGFDLFNYMALVVCARSRDYAEITFRKFADELEEKYKKGESAFKGAEKNRVTWEGIAVWPYLGHTFKSLKNQGSIMTGSAYPNIWDLTYDAEDESLHSMAEAYTRTYINTCLDNKVKVLRGIMERGKCDGVVYHLNRSCKLMSFLNVETAEKVQEANGLPYVSFDGDQTDPRNFAPAQYDTRVQALGEMMDQAAQTAGE